MDANTTAPATTTPACNRVVDEDTECAAPAAFRIDWDSFGMVPATAYQYACRGCAAECADNVVDYGGTLVALPDAQLAADVAALADY